MIVVRTPLRISFAGGGTDFPDHYLNHGGCVVSTAIDKHIYVSVKKRFDNNIRIGYSKTELADSIDDVEHDLVRETLRKVGIDHGIEISTMADIPSKGSGLGSSSAVTVGLLHALYEYRGVLVTAEQLAQEACEIEIDILGNPIGKQDQYIAAYGGLTLFEFCQDGQIKNRRLNVDDERILRFSENIILFYTGKTRQAGSVLTEQKNNIDAKKEALKDLSKQAYRVCDILENGSNLDEIGQILNATWEKKKSLASGISNPDIDLMYSSAIQAGAIGGKVAGAGGGGFILLYCPPKHQADVRKALSHLREMPVSLEPKGSKVILNA